MATELRGKILPTTPNPVATLGACAFCDDPILSACGIVIERGKIWCCPPCYRADGGQAVLGS